MEPDSGAERDGWNLSRDATRLLPWHPNPTGDLGPTPHSATVADDRVTAAHLSFSQTAVVHPGLSPAANTAVAAAAITSSRPRKEIRT